MTKAITKEMITQAESIAKRMSKLKICDYEIQRNKILKDLVKAKLEEQKFEAKDKLNSLLGVQSA